MTIHVAPYEDLAAKAVIDRLDPADHLECELVRGVASTPLAIWADWRTLQPFRLASFVVFSGATPFAVFGLSQTGQAGVAQAALLAKDHHAYRFDLARMAVMIRRALPEYAATHAVRRIEVRSWADHPTAAGLISGLGFHPECQMRGFGLTGAHVFRQWAWLASDHQPPVSACQS